MGVFLEYLMMCFLFESNDRYYPIIVIPNSYFCLNKLLSIRFYFASHGIFPNIVYLHLFGGHHWFI